MINRIYTTENGTFILVDKIALVKRNDLGYTVVMDNIYRLFVSTQDGKNIEQMFINGSCSVDTSTESM